MPATLAHTIAKRAYAELRECMPKEFPHPWEELSKAMRTAFIYMIHEGSEAGCEAMERQITEGDACTKH